MEEVVRSGGGLKWEEKVKLQLQSTDEIPVDHVKAWLFAFISGASVSESTRQTQC